MTTIFYTDNSGEGFSDNIEIESGLTVEQFVQQQGVSLESFSVRVNRQPACMTATLGNGDRVTVIPKKMAGAR
jgi:sulfur carrier protein ThiS